MKFPKWLFALFAATVFATAQAETAPDALVKTVATDVTNVLKSDPGVLGNAAKLRDLIESKLLPNFNFGRMTQLAMGRNWAKASPEQQTALTREFQTLLVRGADLPAQARLIVFDDISELVSAQRAKAWGEVARRVAHEIKNPLTPIQLSAERLQMKLHDKLDEPGQSLLKRSTDTIVTQVQALKTLINEFRDYARLPSAKLVPLDLNTLVNDVLALYGQAVEQGTVQLNLQPDLPRIMGDPALLRQVVHNLVQNALDAVAEHPPTDAAPRVELRTDMSLTEQGDVRAVRLVVRDNGPGFPDKVIKRAFEPYITTKAKGTGLGLAVVKKIADEHEALVRIRNLGSAATTPSGAGDAISISGRPGAQVSLSFSKLSSETPQAGRHYT